MFVDGVNSLKSYTILEVLRFGKVADSAGYIHADDTQRILIHEKR